MRYGTAILVLAFMGSHALAQENTRAIVALSGPFAYRGCPVGFSAQRQSAMELRYAADGQPMKHGQGVKVTLVSSSEKKIVKASLVVHGVSNKRRVLPLSGDGREDLAEIFELALGSDHRLRSEVWTDKVSIVQWVDLTEVQYADGTVWQATHSMRCRVAPSNFQLVTAPVR